MFIVLIFLSHVAHADEPSVVDVQEAALRYAHIEPGEIRDWKKRAKLRALLPRFQLDYGQRSANNIDVGVNDSIYVGAAGVTEGPDKGSYSQNVKTDRDIAVRAIWRLDELIFSDDRLKVSAETRGLLRERRSLLTEVNHHYYLRHQLLGEIELAKKGKLPLKADESLQHVLFVKEVEVRESTAALDALTGGWFSRQGGEK